VLSLFSCPDTPHTLRPGPRTPLGIVARKPFSARFWSVPARETHTTPPHKHWPRHPRIVQCPFLPDPATKNAQRPWRNILTGEDEHILPPADDVNVHTPTIPPRQVCRAHHTPDGGGGRGGGRDRVFPAEYSRAHIATRRTGAHAVIGAIAGTVALDIAGVDPPRALTARPPRWHRRNCRPGESSSARVSLVWIREPHTTCNPSTRSRPDLREAGGRSSFAYQRTP